MPRRIVLAVESQPLGIGVPRPARFQPAREVQRVFRKHGHAVARHIDAMLGLAGAVSEPGADAFAGFDDVDGQSERRCLGEMHGKDGAGEAAADNADS